MMAANWLWGEPFLHWVAHVLLQTILGFTTVTVFIAPVFFWFKKRVLDFFNPGTPGGLGDVRDGEGRPLQIADEDPDDEEPEEGDGPDHHDNGRHPVAARPVPPRAAQAWHR